MPRLPPDDDKQRPHGPSVALTKRVNGVEFGNVFGEALNELWGVKAAQPLFRFDCG